MSILVVGAGAAGGYLGAQWAAAGRDVTFLVHSRTQARLAEDGLCIRSRGQIERTRVRALTSSELPGPYDVVVVAPRRDALAAAIGDLAAGIGPATRIVPILNGIGHLSQLSAACGEERVLGAATRLVTSLGADGVVDETVPGVDMEIGRLDGALCDDLERVAAELSVDNLAVTIRPDILTVMWEKFAFIAATAVLTCLVRSEIGPIARAAGGDALAHGVLDEVSAVAAAEGYPLSGAFLNALTSTLTDTSSTFGPSMFRDMRAGRRVEAAVPADLAQGARGHRIGTPLLDAAMVVIDVHNREVA